MSGTVENPIEDPSQSRHHPKEGKGGRFASNHFLQLFHTSLSFSRKFSHGDRNDARYRDSQKEKDRRGNGDERREVKKEPVEPDQSPGRGTSGKSYGLEKRPKREPVDEGDHHARGSEGTSSK
ncbi:unnamed protein product [Strongylus vulgaris]|uniref:Uncharacterized protein n=1 Tax=Strongylus vulgaris TaxID=40348 RepID=A0A3P7J4N3_STRVU|nr:unnamed protein product [Strongylus vulgaris]